MKLLLRIFTLTLTLVITVGQSRYEPFAEKPGSCPPPLPIQICSQACFSDSQCLDIGKCCPTNCGGTVCSKPVTMRRAVSTEKPGSCPAVPKGRWVCSPTCSVDNDCRGTLKCCKNRCGAMACQKPDIEVVESVNIPVVSSPDNPYNVPRNLYPNSRDSNNVPINPYSDSRDSNNVPINPYPNSRDSNNVPVNPYPNSRDIYNVFRNPYANSRDPDFYPYYLYNYRS